MVSLDILIEEKRKIIMSDNSLEALDIMNRELQKEFMDLVCAEAQQLRTHGKINYSIKIKASFVNFFWRIKNRVKQIFVKTDYFLRKFGVYQNTVKPGLKKTYNFLLKQKKVRINYLYKLNDEEFVKELYRAFLNREADAEGFKHNLNILQNGQCDRLDMIYMFNNSLEGGRTPARICGKYFMRNKKFSQRQEP